MLNLSMKTLLKNFLFNENVYFPKIKKDAMTFSMSLHHGEQRISFSHLSRVAEGHPLRGREALAERSCTDVARKKL